ncbi:MAG: S4 domain-containing protein YaaA [Negativicutes bacterium]|nr:S4 domain-containing protein YaaA [Negativicutes bacterium]
MEPFQYYGEFITLGQFLKTQNIVSSGGEIKSFLTETSVFVNQEREIRRGRKLRSGDTIRIAGIGSWQLLQGTNQ